ncbi:MAG TPA: metallopeptidase family protein [Ktedonobacteraceae bacterium]|nr:metallopeptidase family protein [Ktedonobacteraceae bacterium]
MADSEPFHEELETTQVHTVPEIFGELQEDEDDAEEYQPSIGSEQRSSSSFLILLGLLVVLLVLSGTLYFPLSDFYRLLIVTVLLGLGALSISLYTRYSRPTAEKPPDTKGEPVLDSSSEQPTPTPFEQLVQEALSAIPPEFQEQMENLVVIVEHEPDEETLQRVGIKEGHFLLGLYQGTPLTAYSHFVSLPERITIYQATIERYCGGDPERIRERVRATVFHEVAHHFGIDHEDMPIWVK